ncbi:MAG: IS91 family transposase, partial [Gammaproteobacteria bacterium]
RAGRLEFFAQHQPLTEAGAFADFLRPLRQIDWVVYAKRPFSGPETVLAYLSRYTHRVAIAHSRLIAHDDQGVTFTWKDYRAKSAQRYKTMRLTNDEFILIHVLPTGFHRIRHFGLFANHQRASTVQQIRTLLLDDADHAEAPSEALNANAIPHNTYVCPACGAPMTVIETIERAHTPRAPPS